jgi:uncharacterized protein YkwD
VPRLRLSLAALLAALVLPGACQAATIAYAPSSEQRVLALLNQIRQQHHLPRLAPSSALRGLARSHSAGMLARDAFVHSASFAPSGGCPR